MSLPLFDAPGKPGALSCGYNNISAVPFPNDTTTCRLARQAALRSLAGCIVDGLDVRGYLHWTLLDNFEWMAGYAKTFGLIAVDRTTFERRVKPSARWLGQVAKNNTLPPTPSDST